MTIYFNLDTYRILMVQGHDSNSKVNKEIIKGENVKKTNIHQDRKGEDSIALNVKITTNFYFK